MEFPEGLQKKEDITDSHFYDSDLVASFTYMLSVGTDLIYQVHILHTFINCIIVMSFFICNILQRIPWLLPYTLYKGT